MKKNEKVFKIVFITLTVLILMVIIGSMSVFYFTGEIDNVPHDDRPAIMFIPFAFLFYFTVVALVGFFVFRDATKLGMNAWMWLLIVVYGPNAIGLIIYLIFRFLEKRKKRCIHCHYAVSDSYIVCPNCGKSPGVSCPECGKFIEPGWKMCPYCKNTLK